MTITFHRLHVLETGVRASFANHKAHHHLQWHCRSLWDCRVDSTVLGEGIAANACLSTSFVFVTAGEWSKQQQELLLFCRVSSCLKSRTGCSLGTALQALPHLRIHVLWFPKLTPSPVPNHAEGIQVMPHAWGSSHTKSTCSMWQGCAPFTATQQLQPTSTCKHAEASFTWCLVRPLAQ